MDVFFCGPSGFGHALLSEARIRGLQRRRFHRERFEIR
jgi:ferredoxin-NADP reductase